VSPMKGCTPLHGRLEQGGRRDALNRNWGDDPQIHRGTFREVRVVFVLTRGRLSNEKTARSSGHRSRHQSRLHRRPVSTCASSSPAICRREGGLTR